MGRAKLPRGKRPVLVSLLMGMAVTGLGGCAVVGPDTAGNVAEQTGTALHMGKCETFERVGKDQVIARVRKVAQDMALMLVDEETHPDQLKMTYEDVREQKIVITVVQRSVLMTEIRVDVGVFGPEAMGNLMLREILDGWPRAKDVKR